MYYDKTIFSPPENIEVRHLNKTVGAKSIAGLVFPQKIKYLKFVLKQIYVFFLYNRENLLCESATTKIWKNMSVPIFSILKTEKLKFVFFQTVFLSKDKIFPLFKADS
jgi:hypothetical protein